MSSQEELKAHIALLEAVRDAADDVYDAHETERSADPTAKAVSLESLETALDAAEAVLGPSAWEQHVVEKHRRARNPWPLAVCEQPATGYVEDVLNTIEGRRGHHVSIRLRHTEQGTPWKWVGVCTCGWRCMSWYWADEAEPKRGALPMSLEHMHDRVS